MKRWVLGVVLVVFAAGCAVPSGAQDSPVPTPEPTEVPAPPPGDEVPALPSEAVGDVRVFLELVASGVLAGLVGAVLSYVLEEIGQYQELDANLKRLIANTAAIALPLLARGLLDVVPAEVFVSVNPYWTVLVVALAGVYGTKKTFRGVVKPNREN